MLTVRNKGFESLGKQQVPVRQTRRENAEARGCRLPGKTGERRGLKNQHENARSVTWSMGPWLPPARGHFACQLFVLRVGKDLTIVTYR